MEQRLNIHAITPEILDWTCKVQLVDIGKPGEGKERKIKYMNMIFQDEQATHLQENQVKAIVYGADIFLYQERFTLFHTYLITSARVQQPTLRYEKPLHTYEWIVDKKTIVDSIGKDQSDDTQVNPSAPDDLHEDALPPPSIVSMASFQEINEEASRSTKEQLKNVEFSVIPPPSSCTNIQFSKTSNFSFSYLNRCVMYCCKLLPTKISNKHAKKATRTHCH